MDTENLPEEITVDGQLYVKKGTKGKRAVVVVDRGWIFAGDIVDAAAIQIKGM